MHRWTEIPRRLGEERQPLRTIYMCFFAVFGTLANLYVGRLQGVVALVYLIVSVGSLAIVLPFFRRSLFRKADPLYTHRLSGAPWSLTGWRIYLYFIVPACFVAIIQSFSTLIGLFLEFNQSNVPTQPSVNDYITPFLAGTEEIWRWSMIGTVVLIGRLVMRRSWENGKVRGAVFTVAFVLSSVSFGAGHILEFSRDRLQALLLFSMLGALLALMTIVTGRILLVMCTHIAYDLWVTALAHVHGYQAALGLLVYVVLLLAPVVTLIWHRRLFDVSPTWRERVTLSAHQATWQEDYQAVAQELGAVFCRRKKLHVDHVGSTSVPGLLARPIIDVQVGVSSPRLKRRERKQLTRLGYEVCGTVYVRDRLDLRRRQGQAVNVYLVEAYGKIAHANIQIREYLLSEPRIAAEYAALKQRVLADGCLREDSYINAKRPFIAKLLQDIYANTEL